MSHLRIVFALGVLALSPLACGPGDPQEPVPVAPEAESAKEQTPADTGEVGYEPAYPEEVSADGLTEEDVGQQATPHSHGGEPHAHDEPQKEGGHDH